MREKVIVVDTETSGLDPNVDRVVEICIRSLSDERPVLLRRFCCPVPMPQVAVDTHGLTNEILANEPPFGQCAMEIAEYMEWATVISGYNPDFDVEMIRAELARAGYTLKCTNTIIDAMRIWDINEPRPKRHLQAAYARFVNPDGFDGAHGALADVTATCEVINAQLKEFHLESTPWAQLDPDRLKWVGPSRHLEWQLPVTFQGHELIVLTFGKNAGQPLCSVDNGFINWILKNDFPPHVKAICEQLLKIRKQKIPNESMAISIWTRKNV